MDMLGNKMKRAYIQKDRNLVKLEQDLVKRIGQSTRFYYLNTFGHDHYDKNDLSTKEVDEKVINEENMEYMIENFDTHQCELIACALKNETFEARMSIKNLELLKKQDKFSEMDNHLQVYQQALQINLKKICDK